MIEAVSPHFAKPMLPAVFSRLVRQKLNYKQVKIKLWILKH